MVTASMCLATHQVIEVPVVAKALVATVHHKRQDRTAKHNSTGQRTGGGVSNKRCHADRTAAQYNMVLHKLQQAPKHVLMSWYE